MDSDKIAAMLRHALGTDGISSATVWTVEEAKPFVSKEFQWRRDGAENVDDFVGRIAAEAGHVVTSAAVFLPECADDPGAFEYAAVESIRPRGGDVVVSHGIGVFRVCRETNSIEYLQNVAPSSRAILSVGEFLAAELGGSEPVVLPPVGSPPWAFDG